MSLNPKYKIFTLVGLNESGKTTVLEAIDLFQREIKSHEGHTLIPKDQKSNFNGDICITATLELEAQDELAIGDYVKQQQFIIENPIRQVVMKKIYHFENSKFIETVLESNLSVIGRPRRKGSKTKKLIEGDEKLESIKQFIKKDLLPPIIYYPNFLVTFPEKIFLQEDDQDTPVQGFYRQMIQDILDSLDKGLTIEQHIVSRMQSGTVDDKEALEAVIDELSSRITDTVLKSWGKLFKQNRSVGQRQIVATVGTELIGEKQRCYIELRLKIGSDKYQIQELSLGFKWFFAFLMFTEFRKYRGKDKGEILFLLDEPASNLHSAAQNKLLETFIELISKSKLIYTTHSHHLINPLWLEGAYIVKNKALNYDSIDYAAVKTDIEAIPYRIFVAKHPDQTTYFKPILDSLDYKPSDLEAVPNVVIVEGKNDFYSLQYIKEIIVGNTHDDLHFYPGNGASGNDWVIRLYVSWGRPFVVMLDADSAGHDAKEKYLDSIGKILEGKIITLEDVDSKWRGISTESLFTEREQISIIRAINPSATKYTKKSFNVAIQNLLFLKQPIALNKTTIEKFEKIFKVLCSSLK